MGGMMDESGPRNLLGGLLGLGGHGASSLEPLASIASSQIRRQDWGEREDRDTTYQMSVPNELIGSVIGQGGSKIAKIRQMSGTMIKISKGHDPDGSHATERQIHITGYPDSVALAKRLVNMSLDLLKVNNKIIIKCYVPHNITTLLFYRQAEVDVVTRKMTMMINTVKMIGMTTMTDVVITSMQ